MDECRAAQTTTRTTNHYYVTGTSASGIRQSLNHARPGGKSSRTDGLTVWKITWKYRLKQSDQGCAVVSFRTETDIALTLPAWNAPSHAEETLKKSWARYYTALLRHEIGHARIAQAAETEITRRVKALDSSDDCASMRRRLEETAREILAEFRRRDRDYDRRTHHGVKDGAHFP